ncbi:MAG: phosphatidate cytidylyltransferase [Sporolactobacillus sp.]
MKQRLVTGIIAGAVYLFLLWVGSVPFAVFAALIAMLASFETAVMAGVPRRSFMSVATALMTALLVLMPAVLLHFPRAVDDVLLRMLALLALVMVMLPVFRTGSVRSRTAGYLFFTAFYIGMAFDLLVRLRLNSIVLVLFVQLLIWATDSGAYFVGRAFGRHKLAPAISPNKTVEGACGGIVGAVAAAGVFQLIAPPFAAPWLFLPAALLIAVAAQMGDLAESAIKRQFGVKDSGAVLPGHGGLFDRFDSLIFTLLVLFLIGFIG